MKVLHVMEHSLPRLAGYTIRSKYIVDNQRKEGIVPVVITSPLHGKTDRFFKESEKIDGVKYYRTGEFNKVNMSAPLLLRLLRRYLYSRAYRKAIQWVGGCEGVQIIHAHSSYLNGVRANEAARRLGVPSVYEVRGLWQDTAAVVADIDPGHWKYKFIDKMDRKAMLEADKVVTISSLLKEEIVNKGVKESRLHVVPNGVDTGFFKPREKNPGLLKRYGLENRIVFGFIGSIRRIEGLALFLEHLHKLLAKIGDIKVLLVGDGDEVPHLWNIVDQQNLGELVIFTGRVNHDQVLDYYSVIDIFLYPRIDARVNQKVTPLKPLEAMAMEKVVVASDVGGLRELVVDGKNGLLFHVGDGDHLIGRCLELIENPSFRRTLATRAREWVVRERDWSKVIKLYNEVYEDLLDR